jgi:hypothetical protein
MTFTRYYDRSIKEWIDTLELHNLVLRIRGMNLEELGQYKDDLITETRIDPAYKNTREFKIGAKTAIRMMQEARNRGETRTRVVGGRPSIFEFVESAMIGAIIGDEFAKRLKG